ncbi:MAG TPA: LCP family protein [Candidatus Eremiobacteraceae bacterium]|nr:LCP family protein [Candidatus Eremiobacteraceae bacterium]
MKRLAIIVACVVALAIGFALFLRTPLGDYLLRRTTQSVTVGQRPINILVIANNARGVAANDPLGLGTAAGQADVMMVLHVDPLERGIWAIPIPRDALVAQPHWRNPVPKIKTWFFLGDQNTPPNGPQLTAKAVSSLIGLPIDGYLAMNFAGFRQAVDLIGGLDVDVRQRMYDPANSGADFQPGVHHMNGAQVLAYVRIRQNQAGNAYRINDFQRMDAEVEVLSLIRAKLLDPRTAATVLPRFIAKIAPDVATDLPQDRLVRIGFATIGVAVTKVPIDTIADSMTLTSATLPGINSEGEIEGASYDVLDPADVCKRLRRFGAHGCTAGLPAPAAPHRVDVAVYGTSALVKLLHERGYTRARLAGGPTGEALVVYQGADPATAWNLARLMGGGVTVEPSGADGPVVLRE